MTTEIISSGPHKNFEDIKKIDENGIEYWDARELLPLLGYQKWEKAKEKRLKHLNKLCQEPVNLVNSTGQRKCQQPFLAFMRERSVNF